MEQYRQALVVKAFSEAHTRETKSRRNLYVTQKDAAREMKRILLRTSSVEQEAPV